MGKTPYIPKSDLLIVKGNNLIEAKFRFTLWEMRVFTRMVSLLQKDDQEFKLQRLYIKDLITFFGVVSKDDYATIKDVPKSLAKKQVEIPYIGENGEKRYSILSLFPVVTAPDNDESGNAYLELMFNPMLKDTLLELKKLYSKYDIRNVIPLRSVYSFRIFELLKQYEFIGQRSFEVDTLKSLLGASEKYKLYSDFKKRVIVKAQKDLKKHCDIAFSFEEIKKGRKVHKLIFYIVKNQPKIVLKALPETQDETSKENEAPAINKENGLFAELWEYVEGLGISENILQKCINDFSEDYLRKWVPYFQKIMKTPEKAQKIQNPPGYLIHLLKQDPLNIPTEQKKQEKKKQKAKNVEKVQIKQQLKILRQELFEKEKDLALELLRADDLLQDEIMSFIQQRKPNYITQGDMFFPNYEHNRLFAILAMKMVEERFISEFQVLRTGYKDKISQIEAEIK